MKPQEKAQHLKELIIRTLSPLIDNDYLLLDLPYHSNLGDTLIWQGELDFLKALPYKCKYSTWLGGDINVIENYLLPKTILLLQGGGNFGDVWSEPNEFRKIILNRFPNQKAIIFPQTIFYKDKNNLANDAAFYREHPNVTICARDKRSMDLLQKHFPSNRSLLVPDMSFCMDISKFKRTKQAKGAIFIKRDDIELADRIDYSIIPQNADVTDWTCLGANKAYQRASTIRKWGRRMGKFLNFDIGNLANDYYWHHFLRPLNVRTAIQFIDKYEYIYTTRMHAALLAITLGKNDITLFDNCYGKSSSLLNTWLSDVEGLKLII